MRKSYGRGYHDGIRKANAENEARDMNKRRMETIVSGLNSALRKTFDLVPAESPWTAAQIVDEAKRTGQCATLQDTKGRLAALVDRGVVSEPERGKFIRTRIRESQQTDTEDEEEQQQVSIEPQAKQPQSSSVEDDLIGIAEELRGLASRIDNAAVKAAEQMESVSADTKKLRQLQDILKSIGAA